MKKFIRLLTSIIILILAGNSSSGQQKPEKKIITRVSYYKKSLGIDSIKAEQVIKIHLNYKAKMGQVVQDASLNRDARAAKISALMDEKNKSLSTILSSDQQAKIIPGSERKAKPSDKKNLSAQ
jgi:hypothetical protein